MSSKDLKFLDEANWKHIKRGWVYEAAMPYVGQRPLDFFIPDKGNPYRGTVKGFNGDFRPSEVHQIVVSLKQRKVVVVSRDEDINQDNRIKTVNVAPIVSIEPSEHDTEWYKMAVSGEHPFFVYLPEIVTGKECIINVSNITTIHKTLLLNDKFDLSEFLPVIDNKLEYCLQLGAYKADSEVEESVS